MSLVRPSAAVSLYSMDLPAIRMPAASAMLARGVTNFGLLFEANLRGRRLAEHIKAGEYAIPSRATMADIASLLVEGKSIQHKLTAAEGLTSDMIWKLVAKDNALTGAAGPVPAEGTLLPETYLFTHGETRAALLALMARDQRKFLAARWAGRSAGLPFRDPREAVILASIVEKESALPDERRHIAAVFFNRLRLGMKLQSDPTIIYDLTGGYPLGRGIRQSELEAASPHNTYAIAGLPPGPICNPGKDSIAAVLDPETSADLYFVATGKGGHVFSATVAQHQRNVAAFRDFERQEQHLVQEPDAARLTPPPVTPPPAPRLPPVRPGASHRHHRHA